MMFPGSRGLFEEPPAGPVAGAIVPAATAAMALRRERPPRVAVLMPTYNGERWVVEQIASILAQCDVAVTVLVADDGSDDDTVDRIRRAWGGEGAGASQEHGARGTQGAAGHGGTVRLLPAAGRCGSAGVAFLRMIRDVDPGDADYVALADQDDLWRPEKLSRAVAAIEHDGVDAWSSDVDAFWADGRCRRIVKSRPARAHDHLFESAGPGCTFVLPRARHEEFRAFLWRCWEPAGATPVHDWLLYAYARTHGWRWRVDRWPSVLYRQHDRNVTGANAGLRGRIERLRRLRSGDYRIDVLAIARAVGDESDVTRRLRSLRAADRLWLASNAWQMRRDPAEALLLGAMFLVMRGGGGG